MSILTGLALMSDADLSRLAKSSPVGNPVARAGSGPSPTAQAARTELIRRTTALSRRPRASASGESDAQAMIDLTSKLPMAEVYARAATGSPAVRAAARAVIDGHRTARTVYRR